MKDNKPAVVIILSIITFFMIIDVYTPSMPEIAKYFNESNQEVQKTISYGILGTVLSCVISGLYADRWGRKNFLVFGMSFATIGSIITIFSPSSEWFLLGRFMQGIGGGFMPILGFVVIQELYTGLKVLKIFAILGMTFAITPSLAPILGAFLSQHMGWRAVFVFILLTVLVSLLSLIAYLPAKLNTPYTSNMGLIKSYKNIITSNYFVKYAFLSPIYASMAFFEITLMPFYIQSYLGYSALTYSFYLAITAITFAGSSFLSSWLYEKMGIDTVIRLGLALTIISAILLGFIFLVKPESAIAIYLALSLKSVGWGLTFSGSVNNFLNPFQHERTRASTVRTILVQLFLFIGSYSAQFVSTTSIGGLVIFVELSSILAWILYSIPGRNKKKG